MKLRSVALALTSTLAVVPAVAHATPLKFNSVKLAGASSGTEPRIAVDKNADRGGGINGGGAVVYKSNDAGDRFTKAPSKWTQELATIDVDIVAMDMGEKTP